MLAAVPPKELGPFAGLWLDGESMRDGPRGTVIALHQERHWLVDGATYYRLTVSSLVTLHFETPRGSPSRLLGPYSRFSFADGLAYGDDGIVAHLHRDNEWFCFDLGQRFAVMVVRDA